MNKAFLFMCLAVVSLPAFSQKTDLVKFEKVRINYSENSMMVLGGWSAANIVVSGIATNTRNREMRYFHQMNVMWGGINLAIAGLGYWGALKEKVEDAGFFVANFTVVMNVENLAVSNDAHVNVGNEVFHFLNVKDKVLSGEQTFRILDKGYVSAKEFKKNSSLTKMPCYKTGEENLPTGQAGGKRIFHVTI